MTTRGATEVRYHTLVMGQLQPIVSNLTFSNYKIMAGEGIDGRGFTCAGVSEITLKDSMIVANGDDGGCVWNEARRIRFENVFFIDVQSGNGAHALQTKACLLGADPDKPAPNYPTWASFDQCTFQAFQRCPDLRGGVARFNGCVFRPAARNVWTQAHANISECDVFTSGKPADAVYWDVGRPFCLKDPLPNSIWVDVATVTLNGKAIKSPHDLFRMFGPDSVGQSGDIDVPVGTFRKKAN